jgi:hypothetical protein
MGFSNACGAEQEDVLFLIERCRMPVQGQPDMLEMVAEGNTEDFLGFALADHGGRPSARLAIAKDEDGAAAELYALEGPVKERHKAGDPYILEDWRKLTTSDHLYYMCTKYWSDGDVHKYFSPYDSPYDAYINFMNVLDNLKSRAGVKSHARARI